MNDSFHEADAKGRTMASGGLVAILKDLNGVRQIHPDEPGAKNATYFKRYSFYVPDHEAGEGQFKTIPEKYMVMPFYRAYEMSANREGVIVPMEEAMPFLDEYEAKAKEDAKIAKAEADLIIEERRKEKGEIPDVVSPESVKRFEALEARADKQEDMLAKILAAVSPGE